MKTAKEIKNRIMAFQKKRKEMFIATNSIFYNAVKKPLLVINEEELESYAKACAIEFTKQKVKERDEQWKLILNKVSAIEDEVGNLFIRMDEIEDLIKLELK